jgi:hypothetical protein
MYCWRKRKSLRGGEIHLGLTVIITRFTNRPKLFKIKDRFIIGCTGTFRLINLLHYGLDPPKISEGFDRDRYMREDFIPALRKYFKNHGLVETRNGVESFQGPFMMGLDAHLYEVQSDFSVLPAPAYGASVGSGSGAASAVLYFCKKAKMSPEEKLKGALEAGRGDDLLCEGAVRICRYGNAKRKLVNNDPPNSTPSFRAIEYKRSLVGASG